MRLRKNWSARLCVACPKRIVYDYITPDIYSIRNSFSLFQSIDLFYQKAVGFSPFLPSHLIFPCWGMTFLILVPGSNRLLSLSQLSVCSYTVGYQVYNRCFNLFCFELYFFLMCFQSHSLWLLLLSHVFKDNIQTEYISPAHVLLPQSKKNFSTLCRLYFCFGIPGCHLICVLVICCNPCIPYCRAVS